MAARAFPQAHWQPASRDGAIRTGCSLTARQVSPRDTPGRIPPKGRTRNERDGITPEQIARQWRRRASPHLRGRIRPGFPTRRSDAASAKTVRQVVRTISSGLRQVGDRTRVARLAVHAGKRKAGRGTRKVRTSGDEGSSDRGPGDRTDRQNAGERAKAYQAIERAPSPPRRSPHDSFGESWGMKRGDLSATQPLRTQ